MKVFGLAQIRAALDEAAAHAAIEDAFRRFHAGEAEIAAVGHLMFPDAPGDCHTKSAYLAGDDVFVVKVTTGFYGNQALGLPASNGFMAVMSAKTGAVLALLHDQGWLTDRRTALTGAIAAAAILRPGSETLGVVGAGTQARMQALEILRAFPMQRILVWSRNPDRAAALAAELGGEMVATSGACGDADLIVTTTPSTAPLLHAADVRTGARIIAVGADSPGKRELALDLLARARIVVDSKAQCLDHGETRDAVQAGLVDPDTLIPLGSLLARPVAFSADETVVADLTGVAIQDLAIARTVWRALEDVA